MIISFKSLFFFSYCWKLFRVFTFVCDFYLLATYLILRQQNCKYFPWKHKGSLKGDKLYTPHALFYQSPNIFCFSQMPKESLVSWVKKATTFLERTNFLLLEWGGKLLQEVKGAAQSYETAFNDVISTVTNHENFQQVINRENSFMLVIVPVYI